MIYIDPPPPRRNRNGLMHGAGIISMGFLMDAIANRHFEPAYNKRLCLGSRVKRGNGASPPEHQPGARRFFLSDRASEHHLAGAAG